MVKFPILIALLIASTGIASSAQAQAPPDASRMQSQIEALRISSPDVSVSGVPRAPRSPAAPTLFTRRQGNELGIDNMNLMSPNEFFPPFWNGRGISAGDVDRDGYIDLVVATKAGVRLYMNQGGVIFTPRAVEIPQLETLGVLVVALVDFDNDGWLDLFVTSYAKGNYFVLSREGRFEEDRLHKSPEHPYVLTNSLTFGDIDEDGDLDAVSGNWYYGYAKQIPPAEARNSLLFWEDGSYRVVPFENEIVADTLSVLFSDWNQDDHLDLIIGNDFTPPDYYYQGDGQGGLRMITRADGIVPVSTDSTMSIDTGDFNNDLRMDIYVTQIAAGATGEATQVVKRSTVSYCDDLNRSADRAACMDAIRQKLDFEFGPKHEPSNLLRCKKITEKRDRLECAAMMTLLTAIREDDPELCDRIPKGQDQVVFICRGYFEPGLHGTEEEYARAVPIKMNENVLLVAKPDGRFEDVAASMNVRISGWSWNGRFMDLDNDEWLDLYVVNGFWAAHRGTPQKFYYRNLRGKRFEEQADASGLQNFMLQSGYVRFDYDHDGDLDIFANSMNGPVWVYVNNEARNSSVLFDLRDERANRYCIGCKIRIRYGGADELRQLREIKSGGGFVSFDASFAHFGLGDHDLIEAVEVTWSTGEKTTIEGPLPANTRYTITRQ